MIRLIRAIFFGACSLVRTGTSLVQVQFTLLHFLHLKMILPAKRKFWKAQSQKSFFFPALNCSVQLLLKLILFSATKSVSIYLWDHAWIGIELSTLNQNCLFIPSFLVNIVFWNVPPLSSSSAIVILSHYFMSVSATTFWLSFYHLLKHPTEHQISCHNCCWQTDTQLAAWGMEVPLKGKTMLINDNINSMDYGSDKHGKNSKSYIRFCIGFSLFRKDWSWLKFILPLFFNTCSLCSCNPTW